MAKIKNKKALKITLITTASILAIIGVLLFVFLVLLKPEEIPTFSISGYVYADNEPLAGAKVSCGITETETDENGYYYFDKLTKVVEVTVSKDNYIFGNELVFVNSSKENVNFKGFELFSLSGVVKNGDEIVPFAEIEVVSEAGVYKTRANAFGVFNLPRLAGEVKLSAYHESIELFSQTFDKKKQELVVTGTTSLSGKINCDSSSDYDFVLKLNDKVIELNKDLEFLIDNVEPNSRLTLVSENYYIDNSEIIVSIENGKFEFNAEKYYDIEGSVVSGVVPLNNTRIVVGSYKTYANSDGEFSINKVHGKHTINAKLQGYNFEDTYVDYDNSSVKIIGTFNLNGKVFVDDNNLNGIEIVSGEKVVKTNNKGEFVVPSVQLGDIVSVSTASYYVKENDIELSSTSSITFDLSKLYSLDITLSYRGEVLEGVTAIIGKLSYLSDENGKILVTNLFGSNNVEFIFEGYVFEKVYSSDFMNTTLNISPLKIYNLTGIVKSGSNIINNAVVIINDNEIKVDENGCFQVEDLYDSGKLTIKADNYNDKEIKYSIDNKDLEIEIDYDINGIINCGSKVVDNVKVTMGESVTYSDYSGKFTFKGIKGNVTLSYEKEYYTFEDSVASDGSQLSVDCSYKIVGKVTNKIGAISGLSIKLVRNSDTTETITVETDEEGNFEFTGLVGEYLMIYDTNYSETLLPNGYTVDCGGVYNFSDSGYKIKGRIMTGDVPVAGVTVKVGDLVTTTNEEGYYKFDLIIDSDILILSKDGYEFENNNFPVDLSLDGREDIDFNCTYTISGIVASGETLLQNVKVTIGGNDCYTDEDGYYSISGISGKVTPTAELDNYYFDMPEEICATGICNITAMYDAIVAVKTKNVPVNNVEITINNKVYTTDDNGLVTINNIQIGDTLIFNKTGFSINSYTFTSYAGEIEINASYNINGTIYLTSQVLSGVRVECAGVVVISDDNGYFEFVGLEGENQITFIKDNYQFDIMNVTGYDKLTIPAKFTINGNVSVAGIGLEGVLVSAGTLTTYTDQLGNYTISGIKDELTLELEKYGYEFPGEYIVNSPAVINISATYRISGQVKTGNVEIAGAQVKLSNGKTLTTDDSGYFAMSGIDEVINIEVIASGYNTFVIENIDKFTNDLNINLTYTMTINLTNITNLTDVSVSVGGVVSKHSSSTITFENLSGELKIIISKDGYDFSPSQVVVYADTTLSITVKKEFGISGTITTSNGLPATGVTISAGGKETITDSNGYYSLSPFVDPVQIKLIMKVTDTAYKGVSYDYSVNIDQVSTDAVQNFSVSESEYAYFIFKKGYQNLNDALTYQIFGTGIVSDSASGENQDVSIVYKKDSNNQRIIQNLNWHDGKIMGLVDPRIAQLTYVNMNTKEIKYQTIKGSSVSKGTASWTTSWTSTDYATYLNNFGVNAEGYYPYVITKDTISTTSTMTLSDGLYQFTFGLVMSEAMYNYYTIQMANMCSDQSFEEFYYCNITYTIGQDGYIRTMYIDEQYKVSAMLGVTSTVTDKITYNFYTTSANEMINDIKISTVDEINAALTQETPTLVVNSSCTPNYDLYLERRRKLV